MLTAQCSVLNEGYQPCYTAKDAFNEISCFNKHAYIARGDHSFGRDLMVKTLPENELHAGMIED